MHQYINMFAYRYEFMQNALSFIIFFNAYDAQNNKFEKAFQKLGLKIIC